MQADAVVQSVTSCLQEVQSWISKNDAGEASVLPAGKVQEQVGEVEALGLKSSRSSDFHETCTRIAAAFDTPLAFVTLLREEQNDLALGGAETGADRQKRWEFSLAHHVIAADDVLVAADVATDSRFADDNRILEEGIRFFAGAPLRTASKVVIGCLSILDTIPREFGPDDMHRLQQAANALAAELGSMPLSDVSNSSGREPSGL
jgi:GAF domain-containing protein